MLRAILIAVTMTAFAVVSPNGVSAQATAYKTGELTTGLSKQCFYSAGGLGSRNTHTRTVRSFEICPFSITTPAAPVAGRALSALADGIRNIGAIAQRNREARERLELERERLDAYRTLTEAEAEAALARASADRALAETRREAARLDAEEAYKVLVQALWDDYAKTDEYRAAVRQYYEIEEADGSEAAGEFWKLAQASGRAYVHRRWVEMNPYLNN